MGWRFVVQPNELLARFSEIVDDFTDYNLTKAEAIEMSRTEYHLDKRESTEKVQRALDAGNQRWMEAIRIIQAVHGIGVAHKRTEELSKSE